MRLFLRRRVSSERRGELGRKGPARREEMGSGRPGERRRRAGCKRRERPKKSDGKAAHAHAQSCKRMHAHARTHTHAPHKYTRLHTYTRLHIFLSTRGRTLTRSCFGSLRVHARAHTHTHMRAGSRALGCASRVPQEAVQTNPLSKERRRTVYAATMRLACCTIGYCNTPCVLQYWCAVHVSAA